MKCIHSAMLKSYLTVKNLDCFAPARNEVIAMTSTAKTKNNLSPHHPTNTIFNNNAAEITHTVVLTSLALPPNTFATA